MLSEEQKNFWLFEAEKVAERQDNFTRFQLFRIGNFFVETKTSVFFRFKRTIEIYTLTDLPLAYSAQLQALWA